MDHDFSRTSRNNRPKVEDFFEFQNCMVGFGAYGHVYKARSKNSSDTQEYALKHIHTSKSANREISLLRELHHPNVIDLLKTFLSPSDNMMWLLFHYAEYDLGTLLKHHRIGIPNHNERPIPEPMVKSIIYQTLQGLRYLHSQFVIHRDLKPFNILIMGKGPENGRLKIADFGVAKLNATPMLSMTDVDKVVCVLWYRAPEVLLGEDHYTNAIDIWATGCIFGEILTLYPVFYCYIDTKANRSCYNKEALRAVLKVLGIPRGQDWDDVMGLPNFVKFQKDFRFEEYYGNNLRRFINNYRIKPDVNGPAFDLLKGFLTWSPEKRKTAEEAMKHSYFREPTFSKSNIFEGSNIQYPSRKFILNEQNATEEVKIKISEKRNWSKTPKNKTSDIDVQEGSADDENINDESDDEDIVLFQRPMIKLEKSFRTVQIPEMTPRMTKIVNSGRVDFEKICIQGETKSSTFDERDKIIQYALENVSLLL